MQSARVAYNNSQDDGEKNAANLAWIASNNRFGEAEKNLDRIQNELAALRR